MELHLGDCLAVLKTLPSNCIDACVTDPPYGLRFMNKHWDYDVPTVEVWREVLRVLKPGAHLLSFGGTRTYHRLVTNIEDAGFEIRDQIQWLYGSGFPKSMDISKAIDKAAGAEREVIGQRDRYLDGKTRRNLGDCSNLYNSGMSKNGVAEITAPTTPGAKRWAGWGTALKPANEPICLARKPLEGTVAQNVLKYGTGGLNIDASRIETSEVLSGSGKKPLSHGGQNHRPYHDDPEKGGCTPNVQGRFPANILFDEAAAFVLDEQSGASFDRTRVSSGKSLGMFGTGNKNLGQRGFGDSGGASRFFYVAKASSSERSVGLKAPSHHPTVKPVKLMQYLVTLITPPSGLVLDPFMGSGSTGVAAKRRGFDFIGIERERDFVEIAKARIEAEPWP